MNVLAEIVKKKREEIAKLAEDGVPQSAVERSLGRRTIDVPKILARDIGAPLRLIAEIKFKSPSAGALSKKMSAAERAVAYANAGASMVSVLCDGPFFDGSYDDLENARAALDEANADVPVLCKEFVLDAAQLDVARARGADAILLIARILDRDELPALVLAAKSRGLEPLVEIANEEELARALETPALLIGVNARDLDTLAMDSKKAAALVADIPPDRVALHLSGVKSEADVSTVARGRADAALIGEILMREDDPSSLLTRFLEASDG